MEPHRYRPLAAKQIGDIPLSDDSGVDTEVSGGTGDVVVVADRRNETRLRFLELLVGLVIFVLGIALGITYKQKHSMRGCLSATVETTGSFPHLDAITRKFEYEADYGAAPSEPSNKLWSDLLPPRGGFFDYIVDGQQLHATVTAIHLIHCLDSIRQGYWALHDAVSARRDGGQEPFDFDTLPVDISPEHVRHCIDLLRQDTMCQPDLTVEVSRDALGSVTGYGTTHQCRSWPQLLRFVEDWQLHGYKSSEPAQK